MEDSFANHVGGTWSVHRGQNGASQKPYVVWRDFAGLQGAATIEYHADLWKYDFIEYDDDNRRFRLRKKKQKLARFPAEVIFETTKGAFSVLSVHTKSKITPGISPQDVHSTDPKKSHHAICAALEQRARLYHEADLVRQWVLGHQFGSEFGGRVLIAGDLNDGPGKDFFENRFFGTDILEWLRGDIDHVDEIFDAPILRQPKAKQFSAVFYDRIDKVIRELLLDHFLISPQFLSGAIRVKADTARVEHAAYTSQSAVNWHRKSKPKRKKYSSDHRPISVVVKI
jgi:hypothetical protein